MATQATAPKPSIHSIPWSRPLFPCAAVAAGAVADAMGLGVGPVAFSRSTRSIPPKLRGSVPVAWAAKMSWA